MHTFVHASQCIDLYLLMFAEILDFTGIRQAFTLSQGQPSVTVQFGIVDDAIRESVESFTSTISTSAQRVDIVVPTTQVNIVDNEGIEWVHFS